MQVQKSSKVQLSPLKKVSAQSPIRNKSPIKTESTNTTATTTISLTQIQELEDKITALNLKIALILNRTQEKQSSILTSHAIALRDSNQVQSDETLGWRFSSVEELDASRCQQSELDDLRNLIGELTQKPQINKESWITRMTSAVSKMISGLRIPLCARKNIAESLSKSIMDSSLSASDEQLSSESFEKILSESLRKVQYASSEWSNPEKQSVILDHVQLGKRKRRQAFQLLQTEQSYLSFSEGEDDGVKQKAKRAKN